MPAKSAKQYRFMAAMMKGKQRAAAPSKEVAKKFVEETPANKRSVFMKRKK